MLEVLTCDGSFIVGHEVCEQKHVVCTKQSECFVANLLEGEDIIFIRSVSNGVNQYAERR